jgi:hypothetical protein
MIEAFRIYPQMSIGGAERRLGCHVSLLTGGALHPAGTAAFRKRRFSITEPNDKFLVIGAAKASRVRRSSAHFFLDKHKSFSINWRLLRKSAYLVV